MSELPKGYTCKCGKENRFSGYVYAHWDTALVHTCECGRKNEILRGAVFKPSEAETETEGEEMTNTIAVQRITTERLYLTVPQSLALKATEYLTRSGYTVIDSKFMGGTPPHVQQVGEKVHRTEPMNINAIALD